MSKRIKKIQIGNTTYNIMPFDVVKTTTTENENTITTYTFKQN